MSIRAMDDSTLKMLTTLEERDVLRDRCGSGCLVHRLLAERDALAEAVRAMIHCGRGGALCKGCAWADADDMGAGRGNCRARACALLDKHKEVLG